MSTPGPLERATPAGVGQVSSYRRSPVSVRPGAGAIREVKVLSRGMLIPDS